MKKGIWQNRFNNEINNNVLLFTSCISEDYRLIPYDIIANVAHANMLLYSGYITKEEHRAIVNGLNIILKNYKEGNYKLKLELEDVHMNIEYSLGELIGSVVDKLHTARSRNDLIATDLKLYSIDCVYKILKLINEIQEKIVKKCEKELNYVIPGYTHMQRAQAILWGYYLMCYFYKLDRDYNNFEEIIDKLYLCPLGAVAIAGTSLNINPLYTAKELRMSNFYPNAMDATTDRDYIIEIMFKITQLMLHLSSFAEDMIIYSTEEFSLIELDDTIATGSSVMAQKRNPDLFEIVRAKTSKIIGDITAAISLLKALPTGYNKDLQQLKSMYFSQIDDLFSCLKVMIIAISAIKIKDNDWNRYPSFICATDICDFLINKGYPFRKAYDLILTYVRESKNDINKFILLCSKKLKLDKKTVSSILRPINSIKAKRSIGSTSKKEVKSMLANAKRILSLHKRKEYQPYWK